LKCPRNKVDDDKEVGCSYGFHAGTVEYAKDFLGGSGRHLMIVEINPADVVSIPNRLPIPETPAPASTRLWASMRLTCTDPTVRITVRDG
jgi:hypothetical protein